MSAKDRYEVFESLGQNDYLTVHRGWDRRLRRPVAIMELDRRFRSKDRQYDRVWDEILSFAGIEHYGLVRVYEVDKESGWIVTELMKGTMAAQISRAPMSSKEVRTVLRTCLEAIGYLHERGKLHGDVRPANLLIDDEGHVRLSHPVGLAVGGQVPRRTMNQKYLAPELVKPEFGDLGPATDLYCLGFAAYELLTGPAFDGLFQGAGGSTGTGGTAGLGWLRWHTSDEASLPPVKNCVPDAAADVAEAIDRLIRKRVGERPSSASDALGMLAATNGDEAVFSVGDASAPPESSASVGRVQENKREAPMTAGNRPNQRQPRNSDQPAGRRSAQPRPWSQAWIEEKLKDPWVFRSLAAFVLGIAVVVGLALRPNSGGGQPVADGNLSTKPTITTANEPKDSQSIDLLIEEIRGLVAAVSDGNKETRGRIENLQQSLTQAIEASDEASHANLTSLYNALAEVNARLGKTPSSSDSGDIVPSLTNGSGSEDEASVLAALGALRQAIAELESLNTEKQQQILAEISDIEQRHLKKTSFRDTDPATTDPMSNRGSGESPGQPVTPEAFVGRAKWKLSSGDLNGAVADIEAAMRADPTKAKAWSDVAFDAYLARGQQRFEEQNYPSAIEDHSQAIEHADTRPRHALALGHRAVAHAAANQIAAAIQDYEQALTLDEGSVSELAVHISRAYRSRGSESYNAGKFQAAVDDLEASLRLSNGDALALAVLAASQFELGDFDPSATNFQRAFAASAELSKAWGGVAAKAFVQRGMTRFNQENVDGAIADLSEAVTLDGQSADAFVARSRIFVAKGMTNEALRDLADAVRWRPDSPELYAERGRLYLRDAQYDEALSDFSTSAKLAPRRDELWRPFLLDALIARGRRHFDNERFKSALADFTTTLEWSPKDQTALILRGRSRSSLEDYRGAIEDFDTIGALAKESTGESVPADVVLSAVYERGKAYLDLGVNDKALSDFDQAISLSPNNVMAHVKRGIALERMERHQEAFESFDRAVAQDRGSYAALNNRGVSCLQLGRYSDAIDDFTSAISVNDRLANAYFNRHIAYYRCGQFERANADLAHAAKIDPSINP